MPISRDEFDAGERGFETALVAFLKEHSAMAYSAADLVEELTRLGMDVEVEEVAIVLSLLEMRRRVQTREIGGVLYYTYDTRLGFRPPAR